MTHCSSATDGFPIKSCTRPFNLCASGGKLAASSSTERTLAAAAGAAGHAVNLNSKYATSSDDNSRGRVLGAATGDNNDSYSRAVSHPLDRLHASGSRHGSLQDSNNDLPPRSVLRHVQSDLTELTDLVFDELTSGQAGRAYWSLVDAYVSIMP